MGGRTVNLHGRHVHYSDVIMGAMAYQITSLTIVYSTVYSGADQRNIKAGTETNGRHFTGDTFKCIFLNGNVWIYIQISLKFVPRGAINNIPALVQIMAWRRTGDQPLSGPMVA